jgi:hypothetical protein
MYGCSTVEKLGPLPTEEQEYYLPKSTLIQKYPTIDKYEYHLKTKMGYKDDFYDPSGVFNLLSHLFKEREEVEYSEAPDRDNLPLQEDVINRLGEPDHTTRGSYRGNFIMAGLLFVVVGEPVSSLAIPFIVNPEPNREIRHIFEKGSYCIYAYYERNPKTYYKSLMTSWAWKEKNNEAEECK